MRNLIREYIHADYRDVIDGLPAPPDFILSDPPYMTTGLSWDKDFDVAEYVRTLHKISKPTTWLFSFQPLTMYPIFDKHWDYTFDYIWEKTTASGPYMGGPRPLKYHENILVWRRPDAPKSDMYYDTEALRIPGEPYFRRKLINREPTEAEMGMGRPEHRGSRSSGGRFAKSILTWNNKTHMPKKERTPHPTQKPLGMIRYLMGGYCPPGGLVVDLTAGSGTTAKAALSLGRQFWCCEADEKYHKIFDWKAGIEEADATRKLGDYT